MNQPPPGRSATVECLADDLEKPALDDRTYRVIKLPNELEALLIHDSNTDKASASMDVNVGSLADPQDMQGAAHAVEHLLFMGTEKFPGENDYNAYLAKFGGSANAFTAMTSTNYYFEISATSKSDSMNPKNEGLRINENNAPLYGALDRFSQFFVKPLFLQHTLDRELRAVDSEHKKNLQSDNWRSMQLNKNLSSEKHPYSMFATGNYKSLHGDPICHGFNPRETLVAFYQRHYSANRMKLAVLGSEPLDQLQAWVNEFFSKVLNRHLERLRWDNVPAQTEEELCLQTFAKPVSDQRMLEISFPYPDEEELYASQPGRYISYLIGHEGSGSILSHLKSKNWATGLVAGLHTVCPGTSFFSIKVHLTTAGLKEYQAVIKVVFRYIVMLRRQPPCERIAQEQAKLADINFKFRQKTSAARTVSQLSSIMQKPLPRCWLLSGQSLIREFNPEGIRRGLDALRADNFRFMVVSRTFPGDWDMKEQWYGTEYRYEKIPADFMCEIRAMFHDCTVESSELHLPAKNEFVPYQLDVDRSDAMRPLSHPRIVFTSAIMRLWFKKDDRFWVPKANLNILLRTKLVNATPLAALLTQLYTELVDDSLSEYSYNAELAGLRYSFGRSREGLEILISGYNDKMHVLLEKVLHAMRNLEIKQNRFDVIKERLLRELRNFDYREPYRQIATYSHWVCRPHSWTTHELLDELPPITAETVRRFFPSLYQQVYIEILAHGNLNEEDALHFTDIIKATLEPQSLPPSPEKIIRNLVFPSGVDYLYRRDLRDSRNINSCVEYLIQIGDAQDHALQANLLLFAQVVHEPLFNVLRTKEQLGYICSGRPVWNGTHAAYQIFVQGEKDCQYLEERINAFLVHFEKKAREMHEEEIDAHKAGATNKRLEILKNLGQETGRLWYHILNETLDFEIIHRDAENIEMRTKADLLEFMSTYIRPGSPTRAKISVHLRAQANTISVNGQVLLNPQMPTQSTGTQKGAGLEDGTKLDSDIIRISSQNRTILIEDVVAFKASLPLGARPQAMKPLSDFM